MTAPNVALSFEPRIRRLDATRFVVCDPFSVVDAVRSSGVVRVPRGFVFDLASAPRVAWDLFDRLDGGVVAPAVHDLLYRTRGTPPGLVGVAYTRADADRLFRDLMALQGVSWRRRWAGYLGVRLGGASSWGAVPLEIRPEFAT